MSPLFRLGVPWVLGAKEYVLFVLRAFKSSDCPSVAAYLVSWQETFFSTDLRTNDPRVHPIALIQK